MPANKRYAQETSEALREIQALFMYLLKLNRDKKAKKKAPHLSEELWSTERKEPNKGSLIQVSEREGRLHEAAELIGLEIRVSPEECGGDGDVVGNRH